MADRRANGLVGFHFTLLEILHFFGVLLVVLVEAAFECTGLFVEAIVLAADHEAAVHLARGRFGEVHAV